MVAHITRTQLYLAVTADPGAAIVDRVAAALEAAAVPSLLIKSRPGEALEAATVLPLVSLAQARGSAALIEADARLARTLKADGVHVPWSKDTLTRYEEAREIVGTGAIVGADAGRSRHDAMKLGEAGADYVAFGIPLHVEDRDTARARRRDLVAWWGEIFQVPCVAFDVETPEDGAELARAGADFIAVTLPEDIATSGIAEWMRRMADAAAHPAPANEN